MKKNDLSIDEVRAVRERHAAQFGYDLQVIFRDLQAKQKASGRKYEQRPARPVTASVTTK